MRLISMVRPAFTINVRVRHSGSFAKRLQAVNLDIARMRVEDVQYAVRERLEE